jgi:hypothetical protein
MRTTRTRTARTAFVLVALAATLAGCGTGRPAAEAPAPPAQPAAATATTEAPPAPPAAPSAGPAATPATATTPAAATRPGSADAVRTAIAYMHREVGMRNPVAGHFRPTGTGTGEVAVRPRLGEGDRSFTGPVTVVSLQRLRTVWYVLGTRTSDIRVTSPAPLVKISSPVTVTGSALAFEGTVQVTITEDRYGRDVVLGRGSVTGRGDGTPGPFSGRIAFRRPSGTTGSIVFAEISAVEDGGALKATVVRVRFDRTPPLADRISDPLTASDRLIAAWKRGDMAAATKVTDPDIAAGLFESEPPTQRVTGSCRLLKGGKFLCSYPFERYFELSFHVEGGASAGYRVTGFELGD